MATARARSSGASGGKTAPGRHSDIWPSRQQMIENFHKRLGYSKQEAVESAVSWEDTFEKARLGKASKEGEE